MLSGRWATVVLVSLGALFCGDNALAYRPFVGTDAAVADLGELETEFGLAEPMCTGRQRLLTTAETVSGIAGAIWQVNDKLAFDIALRDARVNGHTVNELRASVTFGLPLW
jgi:hypothetical protein